MFIFKATLNERKNGRSRGSFQQKWCYAGNWEVWRKNFYCRHHIISSRWTFGNSKSVVTAQVRIQSGGGGFVVDAALRRLSRYCFCPVHHPTVATYDNFQMCFNPGQRFATFTRLNLALLVLLLAERDCNESRPIATEVSSVHEVTLSCFR